LKALLFYAADGFRNFVMRNAAQPRLKRVSENWASFQSVKYQTRVNPENTVPLMPLFSMFEVFENSRMAS
jgi:hypothetical protein